MAAKVIFRQDGREAVNVRLVRLKHPLRLSVYLFLLRLYGVDLRTLVQDSRRIWRG